MSPWVVIAVYLIVAIVSYALLIAFFERPRIISKEETKGLAAKSAPMKFRWWEWAGYLGIGFPLIVLLSPLILLLCAVMVTGAWLLERSREKNR